MTIDGAALRRSLRARRRGLSEEGRRRAAEGVAKVVVPWIAAVRPPVIAGYLATDGEVDVAACLAAARRAGSTVAYPRVDEDMTFHLVTDDADLVPGAFGIREPPADAPTIEAAQLDVVLAPLVGFDDSCRRIGRGRGYYDRAFGFLLGRARPTRPWLVGVAHECQRVAALPSEPHDVRLDAVVTPAGVTGVLPASDGDSWSSQ